MSASKRREREMMCAKKCFSTEEAALEAIAKMNDNASHFWSVAVRCYPCNICGLWHIAKQPLVVGKVWES